MLRTRTMIGSGCLLFVLLGGGFMLLLRACLSRYDERAAILPAVVYQQDSITLIISLVSFDKTSSYESGPGFTRKTVNTSYYIQSNDLHTAQKIKSVKLKEHAEIKEWPVKILGTAPGIIWIYLGELMAIDPNTLETTARITTLESLNKKLLGKFPKEQRFYTYNPIDHHIYFTATDGTRWKIASQTKLAVEATEPDPENVLINITDSLKRLQEQIQNDEDSLNNQYSRAPYLLYQQGKISAGKYQESLNILTEKRKELNQRRNMIRTTETIHRYARLQEASRQSAISSLSRVNPGYNQLYINTDTTGGRWFGVYTDKEFSNTDQQMRLNRLNDETALRFFYSGDLIYGKNGDALYNPDQKKRTGDDRYLQGGFLLDKTTASPMMLLNGKHLVVHKDVIGKTGKILLTLTDPGGKRLWTNETGLETWFDWKLVRNKLLIFGQSNKAVSGDEANLLLILDLDSGKQVSYDYYTDKR